MSSCESEDIQLELRLKTPPGAAPENAAAGTRLAPAVKRPVEQVDIAECVQLMQQLRNRRVVSKRRHRRFQSAQLRLRNLFAGAEPTDSASANNYVGISDGADAPSWLNLSSAAAMQSQLSMTNTDPELLQRAAESTKRNREISHLMACKPQVAAYNNAQGKLNSSSSSRELLTLQMSESLGLPPLGRQDQKQPTPLRSGSLAPQILSVAGSMVTLSLMPLVLIRLNEPILSLAFDTAGRRLISAEPTRGIRFRSVTYAGDDLIPPASGFLDWRVWARAACVLPCGHLLIATPSNLQLLRPDGSRLAISGNRPGIVGLAVYDRSVLAVESWKGSISVFELPHLHCRKYHPLNLVKPQKNSQPTALCTLGNLAVVAHQNDKLITFEIETGRLRQSVYVSSRSGPKELASCSIIGVLFVSAFADCSIYIFKLKGGALEKTGVLMDPSLKPGPVAWLPINGILFCAGCNAKNSRKYELRSFALQEFDRVNWMPRAIRLPGFKTEE